MVKVYKIIISVFLFVFFPFFAHAASLSISPASGSYEVGDRATVKVIVTSNGTPFNAVSGTLSFPVSIFSVDSVSKAGSVLNFWVTEPSANGGTVKFEGIALGGSGASSGTVLTVNLHAIKTGTDTVSFKSGQVLANDGQGTDITGNLTGGTFSVKEATAKPVTPSKPNTNTEEPVQPAPTLQAPEIMLGTKYGAEAIIGTSDYPKSQALITFVAPDGGKVFILGLADADGSFNTLVPNSLKRGTYTVSAVMIKSDKTNSVTSNVITIDVGNIFSDIGWEVKLLLVLLVLTILYLIIRTHHHFSKSNDKNIKSEISKAGNVVSKSFEILREDVTGYENKKVSELERKHMAEIKKDINEAEKIISKEIKDIDS